MSTSENVIQSEIRSAHDIDYNWETHTGLPQWFAWVANHLLSRMRLDKRDDLDTLHQKLIELAIPERVIPSQYMFLAKLVQHHLQDCVQGISGNEATFSIFLQVVGYRLREIKNEKVHSQEWKQLMANIQHARFMVQSIEDQNQRRCLTFALNATRYAAEEEQPSSTLANIVREVINAMECVNIDIRKPSYLIVMETLLETLEQAPVKREVTKFPLRRKLLKKLGTFTRVKNHRARKRK